MPVTTDLHVEVDWNRDLDYSDSYEDITPYVLSLSTGIGGSASSLTGRQDAGGIRALLNNDDDRFSNFNAASPLMTVPTFVAAGTSSTANGTAPTPALPAGMAIGDCMICVFYSREATDGTVAISSGWKPIYNERSSGGILAVWRRIYRTGDVAPTFTLTGIAAGDDCIAHIMAARHVDRSRPISVKGAIASNGSAQNIGAITGITLPAKAMLVVIGGKADDWTSVATLSQSGMTFVEIGEPDTTTGNDAGLVWDYATVDAGTALAISSKTFTVTGGASAVGKGVMFALNPEPQVRQGALVRVRNNTDVLHVQRLSKITPTVDNQGQKRALLEAAGIFDEMARLQVAPFASEGDTTGAIIAAGLDDAGIDSTGIDAGDITTGPFGTSSGDKVSLLSEVQKVAEHELGQLYEDQESYRPLFKARSNRPANTTSLATFTDATSAALPYEGIEQPDWTGNIFNRCTAGISPFTIGDQQVLVTLPGPYSMQPGGSTPLVARYSPLIEWDGHTRDIYYGSNVPVFQSTTGALSAGFDLTVTPDDLLLLIFISELTGTIITAPSGWETALLNYTLPAGDVNLGVFYKKAVGTEDGLTFSGPTINAARRSAWQLMRFTSWNGKAGDVEITVTPATGTSTAPDSPGVTPSWGVKAEMFVDVVIATTGIILNATNPPSGYTGSLKTASANGYNLFTARRSESSGVTSENPGAWLLASSRLWAALTIAIRGARSVSTGVVGATPNTLDGAFTIAYDNSLGGGVGQQDHENIQISGVPLEEGDQAFSQADYLPSQDILTGVGIRTYPSPATLFADATDAQEYADLVVDRYGEGHPAMRITYTATKSAGLYAQAIALKVNDRISLVASNNAGLGVSEDFFIEGIYRNIVPGNFHQVTYELSPASDAVRDEALLSDGKLLELLAAVDPTTRALILHCLAEHRAIERRIHELEQIVFVLKRTYKWAKFAWPAVVAIAAYALGTR
jgi:hypothetical protein